MIPLLFRPKLLSIQNSLSRRRRSRAESIRVFVLILFALGLSYAIFLGTHSIASKLIEVRPIVEIQPSVPLGLLLLFLGVMILLSSGVNSVSSLYHSRDLDLILASPISPRRFILTKLMEISLSSSWIVVIFGVPAILGFGVAFQASFYFYLSAVVVIPIYLAIPNLLGALLASLFATALPAARTREFLGILACGSFALIFALVELIFPDVNSWRDLNSIVKTISILLLPHQSWMPSFWAATCLGEVLQVGYIGWIKPFSVLLSATLSLGFLTYGYLRLSYFDIFSRARSSKRNSQHRPPRDLLFLGILPIDQDVKGIVEKEARSFTRDSTQILQLILLLGLCILYLYNLRALNAVQGLSAEMRSWWQGFLNVANIALGSFLISAMCTRFAFPSISLEGQSWWILVTSPAGPRKILLGKFIAWLWPACIVATIVYLAGAVAIGGGVYHCTVSILLGFGISLGTVGLAIGLGAYFANFDWEHSSQLIASYGSLVFMFLSMILIALNILPLTLIALLYAELANGALDQSLWAAALTASIAVIFYLNYRVAVRALEVGESALVRRISGSK